MLKIGITVDENSDANSIIDQLKAQDEQTYINIGVQLKDEATDGLQTIEDFQIGDKKFSVIAQNLTSTLRDTYALSGITIEDKNFSVTGNNLSGVLREVNDIVTALGRIQSKSVTITTIK